jgi:DNA-binding protein HU-beta
MYKAELIRTMVKKAEEQNVPLTDKQTRAALSESVTDALKSGEKVVIPGFGTFGMRLASQGRNLFTGERIKISARNVPTFKAGKRLKDAVSA